MATSFFDRIRSVGSQTLDGVARMVASFSERQERHASEIRKQRSAQAQIERQGKGERLMTSIMRGQGGFAWPSAWTQDRNAQVSSFRLWTYIAVDVIAKFIGRQNPRIAMVHAEGHGGGGADQHRRQQARFSSPFAKAKFGEWRYRKTLHAVKPHEEVEDVGADHPLVKLIAKPNTWDRSYSQFIYELVMFLKLTGNGFVWIVPNGLGLPCEMWVLPSNWVWPKIGAGGIQHYELRPYVGGNYGLKLPPEEVIWIQHKNPRSKLDGWSPLSATSEWIDVSRAIFQSWFWSFENGCFASGAIELDPAKYDPDDKDLDNYVSQIYARYQGVANTGRPIILPAGATFNPLTIAPNEMSYRDSADALRDSILASYGVPKELAGIQDAGSEIAMYGPLTQFCMRIAPELQLIGEAFTADLCSRWDTHLRWFYDDPTPENPEQVNKDLEVNFRNGLYSINEGRAVRGLEPIDSLWADEPLVDQNRVPISLAEKQYEQQQQQQQMAAMGGGMPGQPGAQEAPGQEQEQPAPGENPTGGGENVDVDAAGKDWMAELMSGWQEDIGQGKAATVNRIAALNGTNGVHQGNGHA